MAKVAFKPLGYAMEIVAVRLEVLPIGMTESVGSELAQSLEAFAIAN
jgi:hypothetical protein